MEWNSFCERVEEEIISHPELSQSHLDDDMAKQTQSASPKLLRMNYNLNPTPKTADQIQMDVAKMKTADQLKEEAEIKSY